MSRKRPAAQTKARMRNSTEWTGFLARMTANADADENRRENPEEHRLGLHRQPLVKSPHPAPRLQETGEAR